MLATAARSELCSSVSAWLGVQFKNRYVHIWPCKTPAIMSKNSVSPLAFFMEYHYDCYQIVCR